MMSIVITGLGLVTPLGDTAPRTWAALLDGRRITDHSSIDLSGATGRRTRGFVLRRSQHMSRSTATCGAQSAQTGLQIAATQTATEAMRQAGWAEDALRDPRTAVVIGTSKGNIKQFITGGSEPVNRGMPSVFFPQIPLELPFAGPQFTLSAACCSGLHALIHGALLLQSGECRRVLVVAAEASVHPLFLGTFQRLGVLAPPSVGCRPFDRDRSGFLMSEAAAAVCLEHSADAGGRGLARVDRYAMGADARHITAGNPDGRVLQSLLARVLADRPVDLVHAHGTGTVQNDPVELSALHAILGKHAEAVLYAHKGALGHSLGASGLISIVLNVLCHRYGIVPGNINTLRPLPTFLQLVDRPLDRPIHRSVALASGFGGPIAAVTLESPRFD